MVRYRSAVISPTHESCLGNESSDFGRLSNTRRDADKLHSGSNGIAMTSAPSRQITPDVDSLRAALRRVIDPEVDVNIVDLGLVYAIELEADGDPDLIRIVMTMTSPACPMSEMIIADIDQVLDEVLPERWRVTVKIVWDPPWNPDMMADEARQHFGW